MKRRVGGERRVVDPGTLVLVVGDLHDAGDLRAASLRELSGGESGVVDRPDPCGAQERRVIRDGERDAVQLNAIAELWSLAKLIEDQAAAEAWPRSHDRSIDRGTRNWRQIAVRATRVEHVVHAHCDIYIWAHIVGVGPIDFQRGGVKRGS